MIVKPAFSEREKSRWRIMALSFPIGAVLSLINAFDILGKGEILGGWSSIVFGVVIFILFGVNLFYKHLMHWVELVFFYTIALYLFVMAIDKINFYAANNAQGDVFFISALTEIMLWIAIVYVASYLALSILQNSTFMIVSLCSLFLALLYHMIFKDGFHAAIILLWVRELFALFVLVLLITQTGRLNKDYATKDDLTGAYNRREVYHVTASFGVTTYCAGRNLEDTLHAVDGAMYQAKQNGRDRVIVEKKLN